MMATASRRSTNSPIRSVNSPELKKNAVFNFLQIQDKIAIAGAITATFLSPPRLHKPAGIACGARAPSGRVRRFNWL
jgi:hypothetical protein